MLPPALLMHATDWMSYFLGSYEGPIASFPSDAAGQAAAVQNAAAAPRARPHSRFANVSASVPSLLTPFLSPFLLSSPPFSSVSFAWMTAQEDAKGQPNAHHPDHAKPEALALLF